MADIAKLAGLKIPEHVFRGLSTCDLEQRIWTISIGTVFVKGREVHPDADRHQLELGYDGVYEATKVDKLDFGGFPHWEVGGN